MITLQSKASIINAADMAKPSRRVFLKSKNAAERIIHIMPPSPRAVINGIIRSSAALRRCSRIKSSTRKSNDMLTDPRKSDLNAKSRTTVRLLGLV